MPSLPLYTILTPSASGSVRNTSTSQRQITSLVSSSCWNARAIPEVVEGTSTGNLVDFSNDRYLPAWIMHAPRPTSATIVSSKAILP